MHTLGLILGIAPLAAAALLNVFIVAQVVNKLVQLLLTQHHLRTRAPQAGTRRRPVRNAETLATGFPAAH